MICRVGGVQQWLCGVNPAESALRERIDSEYRLALDGVTDVVRKAFLAGSVDCWAVVWSRYKREFRTMSRDFGVPVGLVFANVIDAVGLTTIQ